jgi:hypothetical protein
MFGLFLLHLGYLAPVTLTAGAVAWGIAARALHIPGLALPAIASVVELVLAFEFKRAYVFDFVGGPPPRSFGLLLHSTSVGDLTIIALLAGLGFLGWRWQGRRIGASA